MQTFYVSIIVNVILMVALLSLIFKPKVISYFKKKEKEREKQEITRIKKIVNEYLKELQSD